MISCSISSTEPTKQYTFAIHNNGEIIMEVSSQNVDNASIIGPTMRNKYRDYETMEFCIRLALYESQMKECDCKYLDVVQGRLIKAWFGCQSCVPLLRCGRQYDGNGRQKLCSVIHRIGFG